MSELNLLLLPYDVLMLIFRHLNVVDLRSLMLASKTLKKLIENDSLLWRNVCKERLLVNSSADNNKTLPFNYYHRYRISNNWCKGIFHRNRVLYHHENYMPWLKYLHSQALLLSIGSELQCFPTDKRYIPMCNDYLWAVHVPTVKRYDVRTNDISRFVVRNNLIVCGNRDGCASLYKLGNVRRGPLLMAHVLDCHKNGEVEVTAVEVMNDEQNPCVVTASDSSTVVKFWCLNRHDSAFKNQMICANEFSLGLSGLGIFGVKCLALHSDQSKIAMGLSGNSQPYLLDTVKNQLILTSERTKKVTQAVRDVQWHDENTIMYVTYSGKLQMIDIRTAEMVYNVMDPLNSSLYCVKSDGHNAIVVGSSEYARCVLFDYRSSVQHVQMFFTQKNSSPAYSIDFDSTKLVVAADRSVTVLNFNVNVTSVTQKDYSQSFEIVRVIL